MKNKAKLLVALSMAAIKVGGPVSSGSFVGDDLANVVHRCAYYSELDRADLQQVLEELLENRPDDDCISFVVGLLGGAPIAQILSETAAVDGDTDTPYDG